MTIRNRSQARALALQALCLYDAVGDAFDDQLNSFLQDENVYEDLGMDEPPESGVLPFARRLAQGAWKSRAELDRLLEAKSQDWSLARMTPVDRNILRLGLFELRYILDTPRQVVLSEAVELANRFSDSESSSFVNGLLDAASPDQGGEGARERGSEASEGSV